MSNDSNTILITGATGKQGGAVARELLAAGHRVRAMTRRPDAPAAHELQTLGAEIVAGDLDDASSLEKALDGVWGTFAVQNTWEAGVEREEEQGKRFAEVAHKAGVKHYVYASVGSAHRHTGVPHFENKARVEERVKALAFPSHVILRPAYFMENLLAPNMKGPIDQGQLPMALQATTKLQMIAVADVGKYGKVAFEQGERLNGRAIDISGDELTMPETAAVLSRVTGHPVQFVQVPIDAIRGFSEDLALMLEWFDRVGYNADIAGNAKEFGIAHTSFSSWAEAHFR